MISLNVPVPGRVARLAASLAPALAGLESVRDEYTLVLKRFEADSGEYDRLEKRVRRALDGAPSVDARVSGIEVFREPVSGPGPVVYLAIESQGLHALHGRLVGTFGAIPGLEGPEYVPHVTLGRGGAGGTVASLVSRPVEAVPWTVTALEFYDGRHRERVSRLPLPC